MPYGMPGKICQTDMGQNNSTHLSFWVTFGHFHLSASPRSAAMRRIGSRLGWDFRSNVGKDTPFAGCFKGFCKIWFEFHFEKVKFPFFEVNSYMNCACSTRSGVPPVAPMAKGAAAMRSRVAVETMAQNIQLGKDSGNDWKMCGLMGSDF